MNKRICPECSSDIGDSGRCCNTLCKAYSFKVLDGIEPDTQIICDVCDGEGGTMTMVCYGDMPFEKYTECWNCSGSGIIEE